MVRWADVPDSDRGDFRRRLAIDISSFYLIFQIFVYQVAPPGLNVNIYVILWFSGAILAAHSCVHGYSSVIHFASKFEYLGL